MTRPCFISFFKDGDQINILVKQEDILLPYLLLIIQLYLFSIENLFNQQKRIECMLVTGVNKYA